MRPRRPQPLPVDRPRPLSQLVEGMLPPSDKATCIPAQRPAFNRGDAPPHAATKSSIPESKPAAATLADSKDNVSATVPLFVIDAPLFQSDPNVLDARPADILEVLEDACSTAKAAGYSDEEITRMLTGDAQRGDRRLR
jgi:hypothetical protein